MPIKRKDQILLLHPQRRDIYKIICETPGTYFFELTNALMLPQGTIDWHLRQLEKSGLIKSMKFEGRRIYYPKNLRSEEVEKAFVAIKHPTAKKIFSYVINHDGCYQSEIANALNIHHDTVRHHIERMISVSLISKSKIGRKTCYSLGEVGKKIQEESINTISNTYINALISTLEDNCLVPTILQKTKRSITIRIECPGHDDTTFSISLSDWEFDAQENTIEESAKETALA